MIAGMTGSNDIVKILTMWNCDIFIYIVFTKVSRLPYQHFLLINRFIIVSILKEELVFSLIKSVYIKIHNKITYITIISLDNKEDSN